MGNPEESCKDCPERHIGCHDRCPHHARRTKERVEAQKRRIQERMKAPRAKGWYKTVDKHWRTK